MKEEKKEVKEMSRAGRIILSILFPVLLFAAVLAVLAAHWALSQWGGLTMEEIVFELTAPLEGTGNGMIEDFILRCVVPALAACGCAIAVLVRFRRLSFYHHIAVFGAIGSLAVLVAAAVWFGSRVGLTEYVVNRSTTSDFIEKEYADPKKTDLEFPSRKRNLIQIYLESMEVTFTDKEHGGAFEKDVIPELTGLAAENESFSGQKGILNGGLSLPGTTWTIGAMFGMTSGLPLNVDIERNSMSAMTSFFPQIRTMGDILQDEGYRQMFVLGSDATFGGRRLYFTEHGDFEIRDYVYAKEQGIIPEDYKVWWGMEDEITFGIARDALTELAEDGRPFNLTLLTVDTHFTDGYVCRLCGDEYDEQYSNVFACSSRLVSEFIDWVKEQDFYENTTIMLTGDHPTMDADYCKSVPDDYSRRTYTCYINSAAERSEPDTSRDFSTFDNFPTTLAAMGVKIEGDRLGLGTNLFSKEKTLLETYGADKVRSEVSKKTDFIEKMEQLDPVTQAKVEKYGSVRIRSETYDLTHGWISVSTDPFDLPPDEPYKYIRLKIWVERGGQMIRRWIQTKPLGDGGYYTTFDPLKDLDGYPEIKYQFVIKFKDGASYNLGPEGVFRNLPGHTFLESVLEENDNQHIATAEDDELPDE